MAIGRTPGSSVLSQGTVEVQNSGTPVAAKGAIDLIGSASVAIVGDDVVVTLAVGPTGPPGNPGPIGNPGPTGPAGGTPSVAFSAYPSVATGFTPRVAVGCGIQDGAGAAARGFLAFCTAVSTQGAIFGGSSGYAFGNHFGGGYTCNNFNSTQVSFSGGTINAGKFAVVGG